MESAHVAASLFRARADLLRDKLGLETRIARIDTHVASIEAAICILSPGTKFGAIGTTGIGQLALIRRVLRALSDAEHPMTVRQIAQGCMTDAGLSLSDLTSDVAMILAWLKDRGRVRSVPMAADGVGWEAVHA